MRIDYAETPIHLTNLDQIRFKIPLEGLRRELAICSLTAGVIARIIRPHWASGCFSWGGPRLPYPPFYLHQFERGFVERNIGDVEYTMYSAYRGIENGPLITYPEVILKRQTPTTLTDFSLKTRLGLII